MCAFDDFWNKCWVQAPLEQKRRIVLSAVGLLRVQKEHLYEIGATANESRAYPIDVRQTIRHVYDIAAEISVRPVGRERTEWQGVTSNLQRVAPPGGKSPNGGFEGGPS